MKTRLSKIRLEKMCYDWHWTASYMYFFVTPKELLGIADGLDEFTAHGSFVRARGGRVGQLAFRLPTDLGFDLRSAILKRLKGRLRERPEFTGNRAAFLDNQDSFHTKADLRVIWRIQEGRCYYTSKVLGPSFETAKFHVDHIVPICNGGTDAPTNLALSIPRVNLRKRSLSKKDFLAMFPMDESAMVRMERIDLGRRLYFKDLRRTKIKQRTLPE